MSKHRYINTSFWDDEWVMDLSAAQRMFFLFLLTNPLTEICGAYKITLKHMTFYTGLEREKIQKLLAELEGARKAYYVEGYIILPNWTRHQKLNRSMEISVARAFDSLPETVRASEGFTHAVAVFESVRHPATGCEQSETDYTDTAPNRNRKRNRNLSKPPSEGGGRQQADAAPSPRDGLAGEIVNLWCEAYEDIRDTQYVVTKGSRAKELRAAGKLLAIYREEKPDADTHRARDDCSSIFREFLRASERDKYYRQNANLTFLANKWNEVKEFIRSSNGTNGKRSVQNAGSRFPSAAEAGSNGNGQADDAVRNVI